MLPAGVKELLDAEAWKNLNDKSGKYPVYTASSYLASEEKCNEANFIYILHGDLKTTVLETIQDDRSVVLVLGTENKHGYAEQRLVFNILKENGIDVPVIIARRYDNISKEQMM